MSVSSPLDPLVELVVSHVMPECRARTIAEYLADRCASLSLASLHSSSHSSLRYDRFLTGDLGLEARQLSAWIALLRGTRAVQRRDGRTVGGFPGLLESLLRGPLRPEQQRRFDRLARTAAGSTSSGTDCTDRVRHQT